MEASDEGRLYPALPISTRFCVLGGGPTGLSAAFALRELGYDKITVFERHHTVGGMCETVEIQGRKYDLGGQVVARESAPTIKSLAQKAGVEMEDLAAHKLALIDCKTGEHEDLKIAEGYVSIMQLTLELQAKADATGRHGVHALSSLAPESSSSFLSARGMKAVPKAVAYGYTASGYGYPSHMPYAYLHEFIRTSMFGKVMRIKGGYTGLWERIAELLPCVRCNSQVIRVERRDKVGVYVRNLETEEEECLEFDKIVMTGATPIINPGCMLSYSPKESELFANVQVTEYYTSVLKVSGFDKLPAGFYYCKNYVDDHETTGHPVAMQKFYEDTDIYLFWSYGSAEIDQQQMTAFLLEDVRTMGGTVESIILQRKWNYFPHVGSPDVLDGIYDELEALQGQQHSYYAGGLFAFELTERNAAYAMKLVARMFGTKQQPPSVKTLINVPGKTYAIEHLSEREGFQFPDLPSVDEYLRYYAKHSVLKGTVLYTWLNENGEESDKRTYKQLDRRANVIAANLRSSKVGLHEGDRVMLLYMPGLDFIEAFFGCLRAKVLPVPLIPPDVRQTASSHALSKVENVAKLCAAKAVLSTVAYHTAVRASGIRSLFAKTMRLSSPTIQGPSWPKLPWLHTDSWTAKATSNEEIRALDEEQEHKAPCFLQFTSGSTGDAKGVIITHSALIHNVKLMRKRYRSTSRTVLVSWLPQYHDMGLIGGLFTALVSGGTAILFSPTSFVRRPLMWLEVLSKYEATHSAGPNFAFELVAKRLELLMHKGEADQSSFDLSKLKFLMVSAEPVRAATLQKFLKLLESSGLQEQVLAPGYGLAENCVFVSVAWGHEQPLVVDHQGKVCCGLVRRGDRDVDIRIVDPESFREVAEGVEGEVWVRSPSRGSGYWLLPEQSTAAFEARIAEGAEDETFLRTGDLGRVIQGMLFMTGRIKELIIVRGQNIYPSDIEKTVEACSEALRPGCCAAFGAPPSVLKSKGIPVDSTSQDVGIVVVAEVRNEQNLDPEALTSRIASTVAIEHGVSVASVNLIKPRTISKTSSGKLRRLECLKEFSENRLESISSNLRKKSLRRSRTFPGRSCNLSGSSPPSPVPGKAEDVTKFLIKMLAERLNIPEGEIATSKSFADYGMDSTSVVWAAQKLSNFLGTHVAAVDIYTAGCISELAEVANELAGKSGARLQQTAIKLEQVFEEQAPESQIPSKEDIRRFILKMISEKTSIEVDKLSVSKSFAEYGLDSVAVVWASQKLSSYLGIHVAAIDIYTAGHISELCDVVHDLLTKEKPAKRAVQKQAHSFPEADNDDFENELVSDSQFEDGLHPSFRRQVTISLLQIVGVVYIAAVLLIPAMVILRHLAVVLSTCKSSWFLTLVVLLVPAAWLIYIAAIFLIVSCSTVTLPNLYLRSTVPLWSFDFVRWWTNYRLQDFVSSRVVAQVQGTMFVNLWYRLLGAQIGAGVQLGTTDITDPSLLVIADSVVISEGATLQSHEVRDGAVQFKPIRLGRGTAVGSYSYIGMGTTLKASSVSALGKIDGNIRQGLQAESLQANDQTTSSLICGALWHVLGIYIVSLVAATSAAISFFVFRWLASEPYNSYSASYWRAGYIIFTSIGVFPWAVSSAVILAVIQDPGFVLNVLRGVLANGTLLPYLFSIAVVYVAYAVILSVVTCALKWALVGQVQEKVLLAGAFSWNYRLWLVQRLLVSAHMKFAGLLSGTEAACIYLRFLGAKIGHMASIRGVNVILNPDLLELGDRSHLGDFSKIITGVAGNQQSTSEKIRIGEDCVVGAQSVVMPGSRMENKSWLGAMSLARSGSTLRQGGVYIGAEKPVLIYKHAQDDERDARLECMDPAYRKLVANLSAHIAKTSQSVNSRYFHRAGVAAKGTMTMVEEFTGVPDHDLFSPGKSFSVTVRHSNSLSSDDDARPDARGASLRISRDGSEEALLDLTLKTGKAFYARNILDFVTWLTKGVKHREEMVSKRPHIGDAVWDSLRLGSSYAELHYYSNVCRIFRSTSGEESYVRFRLRPLDSKFTVDEGKIERQGLLPPDTGALPRRKQDEHLPREFMRSDFSNRVMSAEGVKYLFQIQLHPIPGSATECEDIIDCTRPWDEKCFPYIDVAVIHLNELLDSASTESIRFNPRNGVANLDIIPATSMQESASIDHGRSVAYDIAQYVRSGMSLPPAWRTLLQEADVVTQIREQSSLCPASAALLPDNISIKPESHYQEQHEMQGFNLLLVRSCLQPLLQLTLPVTILAFSLFATLLPATFLAMKLQAGTTAVLALSPVMYMASAAIFASISILAKRVFLGEAIKTRARSKLEDESSRSSDLWGWRTVKDTSWQAINLILNAYMMDLFKGSELGNWYLRALGANIGEASYMDSNLALNPELLTVGSGSCIGRNALMFGHLYEQGNVKFGSNVIGDFAFAGARSLMLPGSKLEDGSQLQALSLVMKNEVIKTIT